LNIYPIRLRFSTQTTVATSRYSGSAWRGAFGHALKKLVCIFKSGHCEHCPLLVSCAYPMIFESHLTTDTARGIPSPYTLYPVCEQRQVHLYLTIMGDKAIGFFPFILHALRVAGEQGVGRCVYSFEVVEQLDAGVWKPLQSQPVALSSMLPQAAAHALTMNLITPVRFKHQGHFIRPDTLTLDLWIKALQRRLISLAGSWGNEAAMQQYCEIDVIGEWQTPHFRWQEMERYSSRQQSAMKIGGVIGSVDLSAEQVQQLWPLLWLGQWTHIGKITTMGMGRYEMVPLVQGGEE